MTAETLAAQHLTGPYEGCLNMAIDWVLRCGMTGGLNDLEAVGLSAAEEGHDDITIAAALLVISGDVSPAPRLKSRRVPRPKHPA